MVTIRYIIKKDDGTVVENTMNGLGISYLHGSGVLLREFEENMIGLKAGESKQIAIRNKGMDDIKIEVKVDAIRLPTNQESGYRFHDRSNNRVCGLDCIC